MCVAGWAGEPVDSLMINTTWSHHKGMEEIRFCLNFINFDDF